MPVRVAAAAAPDSDTRMHSRQHHTWMLLLVVQRYNAMLAWPLMCCRGQGVAACHTVMRAWAQ